MLKYAYMLLHQFSKKKNWRQKKKYFKQYTPPNILCTCPGVSKRHEKHLVGKICFTRGVFNQTYVSMITQSVLS